MRRPSPAIAISLAALVIALSGTAYAAGGKSLILGHKNKAKATTSLTDTKGTPLSLHAPAGKAPLAVSNSKQVARLNASLLQGKSPAQFGAVETARVMDVPGVPSCVSTSGCLSLNYGAVSGISTSTTDQTTVDSLSPGQSMVIRDLSAVSTSPAFAPDTFQVGVDVNDQGGATLTCVMIGSATSCHDTTHAVKVPAGSRLAITVIRKQAQGSMGGPGADFLVGFTMTPA